MKKYKMTPRLIVEWEGGLDRQPTGFPIADTDAEVEHLQKVFEKITEHPEGEAGKG